MDTWTLEESRFFLKDSVRMAVDFSGTEQSRGVPPPPIEKPCDAAATRIPLPAPDAWQGIATVDLAAAIRGRESRRRYARTSMTIDQLAFLLWSTQGIRRRLNVATALRTVPSAGARHAFETYLCVLNVAGLNPGVYRYLPLSHELLCVSQPQHLSASMVEGTLGQSFVGQSAVLFAWAAIPRRMEWRYGLASAKVIAIDAGHVCQNLYLACEAVGAGACAIAAYWQEGMDALLGVDGREEFVVYLAAVGKRADE